MKVTLELTGEEALELMGFIGSVTGPANAVEAAFDALDEALRPIYGPDWGALLATDAFRRGQGLPRTNV